MALQVSKMIKWFNGNDLFSRYNDILIFFYFVCGTILLNVMSLKDYPDRQEIKKGYEEIVRALKLTRKFSNVSSCLLKNLSLISGIKSKVYSENKKYIGEIPELKICALSPSDLDPWVIPLGSSLDPFSCCIVSKSCPIYKFLLVSNWENDPAIVSDRMRNKVYFSENEASSVQNLKHKDLKPTDPLKKIGGTVGGIPNQKKHLHKNINLSHLVYKKDGWVSINYTERDYNLAMFKLMSDSFTSNNTDDNPLRKSTSQPHPAHKYGIENSYEIIKTTQPLNPNTFIDSYSNKQGSYDLKMKYAQDQHKSPKILRSKEHKQNTMQKNNSYNLYGDIALIPEIETPVSNSSKRKTPEKIEDPSSSNPSFKNKISYLISSRSSP
ncbi:hypothetical protein AYI68_g2209 [Smittium mucronatum]|uniref:Uncharacterized protein n=1 Tax=Smittium mucronatum TaxID=133383 RepID=A0A1R0H3D1_9FUNG|nr:hypothetical protein AYI68_g2209 [Smittium mucronatum]